MISSWFSLQFLVSGVSFNSAIISGNKAYECQLSQFLVSAVGEHPHWKLCYRASTHGWAASTFHSRCDGKRDTVTVVKVGQYVFGGYVDIPWGNYYLLRIPNLEYNLRDQAGWSFGLSLAEVTLAALSLAEGGWGGGEILFIT